MNNVQNWEKLIGFSSACLVRPGRSGRGGKSRNLTTSIIKQTHAYDSGVSTPDDIIDHRRRVVQPRTNDQKAASRASIKLEEGDIKGAMRILSSDENLVTPNEDSFNALLALHPQGSVRSSSSTGCSSSFAGVPSGHQERNFFFPQRFSRWPGWIKTTTSQGSTVRSHCGGSLIICNNRSN